MRQSANATQPLTPPGVSLGIAIILVALGILLGLVVRGDRQLQVDVAILEAIQRLSLPGVDALVTCSNLAFSTVGAIVLGILFLVATRVLRQPALALQLGIVIVLRLMGEVWKPIFDSPRPGMEYQPDPSLVPSTMGYPSGHAQTAAIVTGMLVVFTIALGLPRPIRILAITAAALVTALALFARIRIGAHWPSDTLGGLMFGMAAMALLQFLAWRIPQLRNPQRPESPSVETWGTPLDASNCTPPGDRNP
jgi:membrane-associated phospholipid phosphatase